MDKVIKEMEENKNVIIDGKLVYELEQELQRARAEKERLKKEVRLYDCIDKWGTEQCRCACRCLGNEFCQDADKKIDELKAENEKLKTDIAIYKGIIDADKAENERLKEEIKGANQ